MRREMNDSSTPGEALCPFLCRCRAEEGSQLPGKELGDAFYLAARVGERRKIQTSAQRSRQACSCEWGRHALGERVPENRIAEGSHRKHLPCKLGRLSFGV